MVKSFPQTRWTTIASGLLVLSIASLFVCFIAIPFYYFGIDRYSFIDITRQVPPSTGYHTWIAPFGWIVALAGGPGRFLLPLGIVVFGVSLITNWHLLTHRERTGWSIVAVFTGSVCCLMWSSRGWSMLTWFID